MIGSPRGCKLAGSESGVTYRHDNIQWGRYEWLGFMSPKALGFTGKAGHWNKVRDVPTRRKELTAVGQATSGVAGVL